MVSGSLVSRRFDESDKPYGKYDFDVFAGDIKVLLDELQISNSVLGDFSFGAAPAIRFVSRYNKGHVECQALMQ